MTWALVVCIGITWAGCGSYHEREMPDEATCLRVLAAMKTGDQPVAESQNKRNTVAYCMPKQSPAKKTT